MLSGQRVLVAGASGLIGRALAIELAMDNEVYGVARFTNESARQSLQFHGVIPIALDITRDSLGSLPGDLDYIFNEVLLVHRCSEFPKETFATNAFSVAKLLERFKGCKGVVLGSTGSVYRKSSQPVSEEAPLSGDAGPITNYVLSKICGDTFATYFSEIHNIPVAILRYYYPYNEIAGVVPSMVQQVMEGQRIAENPAAVNPLFISDVVDFTIKAATACNCPPNILNIGGEEIVSYNALAVMVGQALGREPQFTPMGQVPAESWVCDSRKRISLLGQQQVSLAQGIARVVAAFRQRRLDTPPAPESNRGTRS